MATNWITPQASDINSAYPAVFASQDQQDWNADALAAVWLPQIVQMFLGAIKEGNRVPISLTPNSVPPELVPHVWALTAEQVVVNSQRMVSLIVIEGENGPMARSITAARTMLEKIRGGLNLTIPTDPDPNQTPLGVAWDDFQSDSGNQTLVSMTTDFANPTVQ